MKTTFLILLISYGAFAMGSKKPLPVSPQLETEISQVPLGEGFDVVFTPVKGYATASQAAMVEKASRKLNEVIKGQCFKDFFKGATLKETGGRTNAQVIDHLLSFREVVPVKFYFKKWGSCLGCTSAIAYRQPPQKTINLNSSFFDKEVSVCRWAATMAHESLGHSLGNYTHPAKWSAFREYTVPYKLGGGKKEYGSNAFSECCSE